MDGVAGPSGAARLVLTLIAPTFPIRAGSITTATLIVENRSMETEALWFAVQGLPLGWWRLSRANTSLAPTRRAEVTIVLEPPRDFRATAGTHSFSVTAVTADGLQSVAAGDFTILPFDDHSAELLETDGQFRLALSNLGNQPLAWQLRAQNVSRRIDCQVDKPFVELSPGEQRRLPVRAVPAHRTLFGPPEERSFEVQAIPERGEDSRLGGRIVVRPLFRDWRRPAATLAAVLAASLALASHFTGIPNNLPLVSIRRATNAHVLGVAPPSTAIFVPLVAPAPSDALAHGGNAVVVNSPLGSCLLVRQYHTRQSSDPRSRTLGQLCDGDHVRIVSDSVEDEGFVWWTVDNGKGLVGWAAEKPMGGGDVYLKPAP